MMGFSPALVLAALIALLAILTVGMVESPENSERLIGLFSTPIGILILVLRQDYLAYRLEKKTAAKAEEVKQAAVAEAKKIQQTVAVTNAMRDDTIKVLTEKVETMAGDVHQGIEQNNGRVDQLVKEVRAAGFAAGAKSEADKPREP